MPEFRGAPNTWKRSLEIDPFFLPVVVGGAAVPIRIGRALLEAKGITSYVMQNPTPYWVWYRGWTGTETPMLNPMRMGHLIRPGGEHLRASQVPDWIVAMPWDRPGWPLFQTDGTTPVIPNAKAELVYMLGSGGVT